MLPRIAHYWPRETVARMMEGAGLEDVKLAWVNQMSWSAIGTRPTPILKAIQADDRARGSGAVAPAKIAKS